MRDVAISRHMGYMVRHEDTDIVGSCEKIQNTHIAIARVPHERSVHRLDLATRSSSSFFCDAEFSQQGSQRIRLKVFNLDRVRV